MKTIERVLLVWLVVTFILTVGIIFFPFKILVADPQLTVDEDAVYQAGDEVPYASSSCKRFPISGTVNKTISPVPNPLNLTYHLESYSSNSDTGCVEFQTSIFLPDSLPPGEYEATVKVSYFPFRAFWPEIYTAKVSVEN